MPKHILQIRCVTRSVRLVVTESDPFHKAPQKSTLGTYCYRVSLSHPADQMHCVHTVLYRTTRANISLVKAILEGSLILSTCRASKSCGGRERSKPGAKADVMRSMGAKMGFPTLPHTNYPKCRSTRKIRGNGFIDLVLFFDSLALQKNRKYPLILSSSF
ncbi:hypothetical protein ECG_05734 [Echinococcus granulosus]|nr:hypothetical protein ECG_05734 [Echinococcus granulosus]